jgi:hypothetical protein
VRVLSAVKIASTRIHTMSITICGILIKNISIFSGKNKVESKEMKDRYYRICIIVYDMIS